MSDTVNTIEYIQWLRGPVLDHLPPALQELAPDRCPELTMAIPQDMIFRRAFRDLCIDKSLRLHQWYNVFMEIEGIGLRRGVDIASAIRAGLTIDIRPDILVLERPEELPKLITQAQWRWGDEPSAGPISLKSLQSFRTWWSTASAPAPKLLS